MKYIVICPGEGDVSVEALTKEELEARLTANYYGMQAGPLKDADATRWRHIVIIRGEVVIPQKEEVVIKWVLP